MLFLMITAKNGRRLSQASITRMGTQPLEKLGIRVTENGAQCDFYALCAHFFHSVKRLIQADILQSIAFSFNRNGYGLDVIQ